MILQDFKTFCIEYYIPQLVRFKRSLKTLYSIVVQHGLGYKKTECKIQLRKTLPFQEYIVNTLVICFMLPVAIISLTEL